MKDAYYFSHDSNARNDLKMVKLRRKLGLSGVGLFWCVVEMLREAESYKLSLSDIDDICYELRCEPDYFDALFECELLSKNDAEFWSESLSERMTKLDETRRRRSEAGAKGGKAKAKRKPGLSPSKQLKKSKVNESIEKVYCHYPSKCLVSKRSTSKSSKDKDKISKLLSDHTEAELIQIIDLYKNECLTTQTFMKNFQTFLNNLPDKEGLKQEIQKPKQQKLKEL
jgi:hypothetical protein